MPSSARGSFAVGGYCVANSCRGNRHYCVLFTGDCATRRSCKRQHLLHVATLSPTEQQQKNNPATLGIIAFRSDAGGRIRTVIRTEVHQRKGDDHASYLLLLVTLAVGAMFSGPASAQAWTQVGYAFLQRRSQHWFHHRRSSADAMCLQSSSRCRAPGATPIL